MKHIELKLVSKFFDKMRSLERGVPNHGGIYQGRCEQEVFVSRFSRLLFKSIEAIKFCLDDGNIEYAIPIPEYRVTTTAFSDNKRHEYKGYALSHALGHSDEVYFAFIDHRCNRRSIKLDHNAILRIMYQKVSYKKYGSIAQQFGMTFKERWMKEYFPLSHRGRLKCETTRFIKKLRVNSMADIVKIQEFLENNWKFKYFNDKKEGFRMVENKFIIDWDDYSLKEVKQLRKKPTGEMQLAVDLYNLTHKFLN